MKVVRKKVIAILRKKVPSGLKYDENYFLPFFFGRFVNAFMQNSRRIQGQNRFYELLYHLKRYFGIFFSSCLFIYFLKLVSIAFFFRKKLISGNIRQIPFINNSFKSLCTGVLYFRQSLKGTSVVFKSIREFMSILLNYRLFKQVFFRNLQKRKVVQDFSKLRKVIKRFVANSRFLSSKFYHYKTAFHNRVYLRFVRKFIDYKNRSIAFKKYGISKFFVRSYKFGLFRGVNNSLSNFRKILLKRKLSLIKDYQEYPLDFIGLRFKRVVKREIGFISLLFSCIFYGSRKLSFFKDLEESLKTLKKKIKIKVKKRLFFKTKTEFLRYKRKIFELKKRKSYSINFLSLVSESRQTPRKLNGKRIWLKKADYIKLKYSPQTKARLFFLRLKRKVRKLFFIKVYNRMLVYGFAVRGLKSSLDWQLQNVIFNYKKYLSIENFDRIISFFRRFYCGAFGENKVLGLRPFYRLKMRKRPKKGRYKGFKKWQRKPYEYLKSEWAVRQADNYFRLNNLSNSKLLYSSFRYLWIVFHDNIMIEFISKLRAVFVGRDVVNEKVLAVLFSKFLLMKLSNLTKKLFFLKKVLSKKRSFFSFIFDYLLKSMVRSSDKYKKRTRKFLSMLKKKGGSLKPKLKKRLRLKKSSVERRVMFILKKNKDVVKKK